MRKMKGLMLMILNDRADCIVLLVYVLSINNSCMLHEFIRVLRIKILLRDGCIVVWVLCVSDSNCLSLLRLNSIEV